MNSIKKIRIADGKFVNCQRNMEVEREPVDSDTFSLKATKDSTEKWSGDIDDKGNIHIACTSDTNDFICDIKANGAYTMYKDGALAKEGQFPLHNGKLSGEFTVSGIVLATSKENAPSFCKFINEDLLQFLTEHGITDIETKEPNTPSSGFVTDEGHSYAVSRYFSDSEIPTYTISCKHWSKDGVDIKHEVTLKTKRDPFSIKNLPKIEYKNGDFTAKYPKIHLTSIDEQFAKHNKEDVRKIVDQPKKHKVTDKERN